jgi:hypothetical protein
MDVKKIAKFIWTVLEAHAQARAAQHLVNTGRWRQAQNLLSK